MKTNKNIKSIVKSITNSNNICLFFHKKPDGDTLGGVFGLYEFIKDTFPKKNVVIVDLTTEDLIYDIFKYIDFEYDDNFIKDSLGILIDIPSANLLKSDKYLLCRETIRIDHHPSYDSFTGTQWVDNKYPAACEMVGKLLFKFNKNHATKDVAKYLYLGIETDTGRFLYPSTKPSTLKMASKLLKTGFDITEVNNSIFLRPYNDAKFSSYLLSISKINQNGFAYFVIPKNAFEKFNIKNVNSFVNVLGGIKEIKIWVSLYFDNENDEYSCSIRSRNIPINEIAKNFQGGGHPLAAGCKLKSLKEFDEAKKQINQLLVD